MKQHFLQAFIYACLLLLYLTSATGQTTGGYLSSLSIRQGDTLRLYCSTDLYSVTIPVFRLGTHKILDTSIVITGGLQDVPVAAYTAGCGWKESGKIRIPDSWLPGVYEADLNTFGGIKKMVFVVRPKKSGSYSNIIVNLTVNTWQAYNNWGGKSLYNFNSTDKKGVTKVTFNRPFSDTASTFYFQWADKLVRWLDHENVAVEFCISTDLDRDPELLSHYTVYTTVGHDEYWSHPERIACEQFLASGGRMISLSGNTCWWQVRLEDSLRTLVCYRDWSIDPLYGLYQNSLVTSVWGRFPVFQPETTFLGSSFEYGGYVNNDTLLPASKGYGGYAAYNTHHWIFDSTDLNEGDLIGKDEAIVGYETDGALFKWENGIPVVTGGGGTPWDYRLLGVSPAAGSDGILRGHAVMGYRSLPSGGALFNSGSINWASGLVETDLVVPQIMHNVLTAFSKKQNLPPEFVFTSPVNVIRDIINNDSCYISNRIFPLQFTSIDTFVVNAVDPLDKKINYFWKIGEKIISHNPTCILSPQQKKNFPNGIALVGFATNGTDTISVEWALENSSLVIVSIPPVDTFRVHSKFLYKAKALSSDGRRIGYVLSKTPSWLKISNKGMIYGTLDTIPGIYKVELRVVDQRGNNDHQEFSIIVIDTLKKKDTIKVDTILNTKVQSLASKVEIYPNPCNDRCTIGLTLKEDANVTISILDISGKEVRPLVSGEYLTQGLHEIILTRAEDDNSILVPGIYFCKVSIRFSGGRELNLMEKIVIL